MMSETAGTSERSDQLSWVADVLGWTLSSEAGVGPRDARRFAILPNAHRPKVLVPLGRRDLGPGALAGYNDSMSQPIRLGRAVMGQILRLGLDRLLGIERAVFSARETASPPFLEYLESVLDEPVEVSVALVPTPRPNRKPVLRILSLRGKPLAYAKVGWNDLTRRLVSEEASALRALASAGLRRLRAPELLHAGTWAGRSVVLTSPMTTPLVRRCRRNAPPSIDAEREVSGSMWHGREPLGSNHYVDELLERLREKHAARARLVERLEAVVGRVRDVSSHATFGAWHGDWAPWNMSRLSGALSVWDWERFGGPVPFGFDRAHLHFQVAHMVGGRSVEDAANRALKALEAIPEIRAMGPGGAPSILSLYLIEQVLRLEEGRSAGEAIRPGVVDAIVDHLEAGMKVRG